MDPDWVDVFPIKKEEIPANYVGLLKGTTFNEMIQRNM